MHLSYGGWWPGEEEELKDRIHNEIPTVHFVCPKSNEGASLMAQMVKNPPGMWQTQVRSLGQEDPLEEDMATHSSILAWRIPWTEESGGLLLCPWDSQGKHTGVVCHAFLQGIFPTQENPMDGGAW